MAKYFTGNPCPKGHLAERYTHNGACVLHVPWNLQLMALDDNIKKGNRYVSEA